MFKSDYDAVVDSSSGKPVRTLKTNEIEYDAAYRMMTEYTQARDAQSDDIIWALQHPPVYTQGTSCQQQPLLPSGIPVVKTDRGGQITYHGPGQLVVYPLLDLKRFGLSVSQMVNTLEQAIINCLGDYQISANRVSGAPGVYVGEAKIAALGLRIRRGCSYHGLSLNVDMDLAPFDNIDPCGFNNLKVVQMRDYIDSINIEVVYEKLTQHIIALI